LLGEEEKLRQWTVAGREFWLLGLLLPCGSSFRLLVLAVGSIESRGKVSSVEGRERERRGRTPADPSRSVPWPPATLACRSVCRCGCLQRVEDWVSLRRRKRAKRGSLPVAIRGFWRGEEWRTGVQSRSQLSQHSQSVKQRFRPPSALLNTLRRRNPYFSSARESQLTHPIA
jgi:hypothetical protein